MAGIPPAMRQKLMAWLLQQQQQGGGGAGGPVTPPPGGTPGINPGAPSPYLKGQGGAPGGPGGMGTGLSPIGGQRNTPPYGNTQVPPGAGNLFGSGSTAPMNPPRPTGPIQNMPPSPPPAMGPQLPPGPAAGAATVAGQVANPVTGSGPGAQGPPTSRMGGQPERMSEELIESTMRPTVGYAENQGLMNKQREQARFLQGGGGIDSRGTKSPGFFAANPLGALSRGIAQGFGGMKERKLNKKEREGIDAATEATMEAIKYRSGPKERAKPGKVQSMPPSPARRTPDMEHLRGRFV